MTETLHKKFTKGQSLGPGEDGRTTFVLTTQTEDRDGEQVDPLGGSFDQYAKNPTVQLQHDTDSFPIGSLAAHLPDSEWKPPKGIEPVHPELAIWNEEIGPGTRWEQAGEPRRMALLGDVYLDGIGEGSATAIAKLRAGTLRGGSISFVPIGRASKGESGGNSYDRWNLLEYSLASVPSNPDAVALARKLKALQTKNNPIRKWAVGDRERVTAGECAGGRGVVKAVEGGKVTVALEKALTVYQDRADGKWYVEDPEEPGHRWGPYDTQGAAQAGLRGKNLNQKGANVLNRKLWVQGKSAWLLKAEGAPDDETQEYLRARGLDDVRVEEAEPAGDGWVAQKAENITDWDALKRVMIRMQEARRKLEAAPNFDYENERNALTKIEEEALKLGWKNEHPIEYYLRGGKAAPDQQDEQKRGPNEHQMREVKGETEALADDVAQRAADIAGAGADADDAMEAALEEEQVPLAMRKAVGAIARRKMVEKAVDMTSLPFAQLPKIVQDALRQDGMAANWDRMSRVERNIAFDSVQLTMADWDKLAQQGFKALTRSKGDPAWCPTCDGYGALDAAGQPAADGGTPCATCGGTGAAKAVQKANPIHREMHRGVNIEIEEHLPRPLPPHMQIDFGDRPVETTSPRSFSVRKPRGIARFLGNDTYSAALQEAKQAIDSALLYHSADEINSKSMKALLVGKGAKLQWDSGTPQQHMEMFQAAGVYGPSATIARFDDLPDYAQEQLEAKYGKALLVGPETPGSGGKAKAYIQRGGQWFVTSAGSIVGGPFGSKQEARTWDEGENERKADDLTPGEAQTKDAMSDCVSAKIGKLVGDEGYSQDQASAIAFNMCGQKALAKGVAAKTLRKVRPAVLAKVVSKSSKSEVEQHLASLGLSADIKETDQEFILRPTGGSTIRAVRDAMLWFGPTTTAEGTGLVRTRKNLKSKGGTMKYLIKTARGWYAGPGMWADRKGVAKRVTKAEADELQKQDDLMGDAAQVVEEAADGGFPAPEDEQLDKKALYNSFMKFWCTAPKSEKEELARKVGLNPGIASNSYTQLSDSAESKLARAGGFSKAKGETKAKRKAKKARRKALLAKAPGAVCRVKATGQVVLVRSAKRKGDDDEGEVQTLGIVKVNGEADEAEPKALRRKAKWPKIGAGDDLSDIKDWAAGIKTELTNWYGNMAANAKNVMPALKDADLTGAEKGDVEEGVDEAFMKAAGELGWELGDQAAETNANTGPNLEVGFQLGDQATTAKAQKRLALPKGLYRKWLKSLAAGVAAKRAPKLRATVVSRAVKFIVKYKQFPDADETEAAKALTDLPDESALLDVEKGLLAAKAARKKAKWAKAFGGCGKAACSKDFFCRRCVKALVQKLRVKGMKGDTDPVHCPYCGWSGTEAQADSGAEGQLICPKCHRMVESGNKYWRKAGAGADGSTDMIKPETSMGNVEGSPTAGGTDALKAKADDTGYPVNDADVLGKNGFGAQDADDPGVEERAAKLLRQLKDAGDDGDADLTDKELEQVEEEIKQYKRHQKERAKAAYSATLDPALLAIIRS